VNQEKQEEKEEIKDEKKNNTKIIEPKVIDVAAEMDWQKDF